MARKYYKKKVNLKMVGAIALASLTSVAAIAGIGALANKSEDGYKKVNAVYAIGGLDDSGNYVESDGTIYTKHGFNVEDMDTVYADIDFDSTISYQLFYYGENDVFISASTVYTDDIKHDVPEGALTCRVEITPIWGEDVKKDNQKVSWLSKGDYASQLKLSVKAAE